MRHRVLLCLAVAFFAMPAVAFAISGIGANPDTLTFAQDVTDGASPAQTSTITNVGSDRIVSAVTTSGPDAADFVLLSGQPNDCSTGLPRTLTTGSQTCEVRVQFDPTTVGSKTATVTVTTNDGSPTVTLNGEATARSLSANPTTIPFGDRSIGAGATTDQTSVITNDGTGPVTLGTPTIGGTDITDFNFASPVVASDCENGDVLQPTDTCDVRVHFDPTFTGMKSAQVTVPSNAPTAPTVDLTGTGTEPILSRSPGTLTFTRDIDDGPTTPPEESTVTNTGSEPVPITSVTIGGADAGNFTRLTDQATDCTTQTLPVNGTCKVRVVFDPTTTGSKTATVTVDSSAPDITITLNGSATQTQLSRSPGTLPFGSKDIDDGATPEQFSTVTNSGTEPVTIAGVDVTGDFAQVTGDSTDCVNGKLLNATQTCKVRITFDPTVTGSRTGSATIHSNAADVSVSLDGTGTQTSISSSPATLPFGNKDIDDGPTSAQTSTITNTGTEPVSVSGIAIGGTDPGQFALLSGNAQDCTTKATINAGETCEARVRFDPTTVGAKSATVSVPSRPEGNIALTGTGIQTELTPAPSTLPFGSQELDAGPTSPQESVVTNSGTEPVTITTVAISGSQRGQFQRLTGMGTDCATGTVLNPTQTCKVRVQFDPSWEGPKSATVIVNSNAPAINIALTGDGAKTTFARSDVPLDSLLFDGAVNAVAYDSAGRTYVGGAFGSIGRRTGRGVKLTSTDDQPDPAFPDVDGPINAVAADGSGGWFIGGSFATVGGVARANLAHILSSGAVDTGWNPNPNNTVNALVRSGAQLYVGGDFTQLAGQGSVRLARLTTSNATLDTNWTPDPNNTVTALTISGSEVYVGGNFATIGGVARGRLARVDVGLGDTDTAWAPATVNGLVNAIAVDGSGVYVGGAFTQVGATTRNRVAKLALLDGALDATWNPNSNATVNALLLDGSSVYVGGAFTNIGTLPRNRIARLSTSGTGDADGWNPDANNTVNAFVMSGTDLYTVGAFTQIGGQTRNRIARLSTSTGLADAWNPNANGTANALALDGSDIYVGGNFTSVGGQTARSRIARLLPDGTVDPDWDPGSNNTVNALLVSGSDVYVGGQFTSIGGQTRNRLARLTTADGGAADLWNPDSSGAVNSLALSGTSLYVGGGFTTVSTQTHNRIAKVPTTGAGTADPAWLPSASGSVLALATDGTSVYAGGTFITMSGPTGNRPFIAKLDAGGTGALDPDWNPSANSTVRALVLSGSYLFAGGDFSAIGGQTRNRLAKLSAGASPDTGMADLAWDPNANNTVRALVIAGNDIYAGGDFTLVGSVSHNDVVRLPTGDGGAHDSGWNPIANGSVNALAATNTRLAVGGSFTTVHAQSRQGVALFDLPRLWRDPSGHQFGSRDTGDGPTGIRTTVVSNAGASPLTFTALTLTGPDAGEFIRLTGGGNDCTSSTTLAPGGTCEVRVQFDPSSTGVKSAWVDIEAPNTPDATIGLAGTGTHTELTRFPTSLSFGGQDIDNGPAADQQSTVTNSGSVPITINSPPMPGDPGGVSITGPDAGDFTRLTGEPTDCFDGRVLNAGQTCKVRVQFDPATTGAKTATATVNTDAGNPTIALDGSGIQTELSRTPATIAFGKQDIDDGASTDQFSTVTNSGTEPVTFTGVGVTGPDAGDFSPASFAAGDCTPTITLTAGQMCKLRYTFNPATVGNKSATVTVTSNAATITAGLTGEGTQTQLTSAPPTLSFGSKDIDDGATAAQFSTITNSGTEPVTISAVNVSGDFAQVSGAGTNCAATTMLTASQTCRVYVEFNPTAVHARAGTVTVMSNAPDATVALDGTGIQTELSRTPATLPFGDKDIDDGATAAQDVTVTNSGTQSITLSNLSIDGGDFAIVSGAGTNCTSTTTLTEGQSCKIYVQFDPAATGTQSQTLTIDSNEVPDLTVALTGRGTQTELSRAPTSLPFGGQDIDSGPSPTMTSVVSNSGSEPVSISSVTLGGSDPGQFVRLTSAGTDCTSSTVLTAGQTCDVRVQFDPSTQGAKSANVSIASNAATITVDLSGTGKETKLSRAPTSLAFGSKDIDDGATADQFSTVTNTGTEDVTLGSVGIIGTDAGHFVRLTDQISDCSTSTTLTAGQTCKVRVQFDPSTVGAKSATARVSANGVDQDVALTGTGIQTELSRSPDTLSFGNMDIDDGATAEQFSTVTNSGTQPVTVSGVSVTGDFAQVTGDATDCVNGKLLNATDTCKVRVTFNPTVPGARTGTATVQSNAADVSVALQGTGIQTTASIAPGTLSFGDKDIDNGATTAQESTVTNTGTQDVHLTGVSLGGSDPGQFNRLTGQGTDCTSSTTLTAGQTCKVRVEFDPTTTGSKSASVTVTSSDVSDLTVSLTGTGIQTELSRSPDTLSFGSKDIDDGATAEQFSTVTNTGTEPVTVSGVSVTGDFAQVTGDGADCVNGKLLNATQTCKVRVTFNPTVTGSRTGTATVQSNAADVSVALQGTGIQTSASIAPSTLSFGSKDIDDGATAEQFSTVTNTGTEPVHLTGVALGGTDPGQFNRLTGAGTDCTSTTTLTAGQTCKVRIEFNPSSTGAKSASATVTTTEVGSLTVALDGTGIQTELSRSPDTLSFGNKDIDDGATAEQFSTVTNSGTQPVTVSGVSVTGDFAQVTGDGADCVNGKLLNATDTCKVRVTFNPTVTGARTGTATVQSNAAAVSVALDGTGIQTSATRTPSTLSFGSKDIDDGATAEQFSTVENTGSEPVHLTGVALGGTDPGQFNRLTGAGTDCTSSTTLTAGQTCKVRIEFNPTTTGAKAASATVTTTEVGSLTVALDGTGIQTELSRAPATLSFGSKDIDDGATAEQFSTVTNSGTQPVTVSGVSVTGDFARVTGNADDCGANNPLAANATCKVRVTFDPTVTGPRTGTATVLSNSADVSVALDGTGIQTSATRTPSTLSFGSRDIDDGATAEQFSTVTNTGTQDVHLTGVSLGGTDPGQFNRLTGQDTDCTSSTTLTAGQTCKVRVEFDPSSVGAKTGSVVVSSNAADVTIALDGTGIQTELTRSPDALNFGSRNVSAGATAPQELTLTNSGTQGITLSAVGVTGTHAGQFQRLSGGAADCGPGTALASGATCTVRVRFRPTSGGAKAAAVTVQASIGDDLVTPLSGTGVPAPRITIPSFSALASSTANKRLKVPVTPVGGTIRSIVVEVRSVKGNKLLGTGRLASASSKRTVTVKLKRRLAPGSYMARARGIDAFKHRTAVGTRKFSVTARRTRSNSGGGGGVNGGGG
jgi:hypothetical protein